jgi:hypothetical protein
LVSKVPPGSLRQVGEDARLKGGVAEPDIRGVAGAEETLETPAQYTEPWLGGEFPNRHASSSVRGDQYQPRERGKTDRKAEILGPSNADPGEARCRDDMNTSTGPSLATK